MKQQSNGERFFTMAETYDRMCRYLVPHYDLLQDELFNIIDVDTDKDITVADLGAGSGILLEKFLKRFPNAKCIWMDFSEDFLKMAQNRLDKYASRVQYVICNLDSDWNKKLERSVDIIVSMSAIHHLDTESKLKVYCRCYDMLNSNGWFFNIDEMKPDDDDSYLDEMNFWYDYVNGKKDDFSGDMSIYYERWKDHFERWKIRNIDNFGIEKVAGDDMHDGYVAQLEWLKDAGFDHVNLIYKYHLWNLIVEKKQSNKEDKMGKTIAEKIFDSHLVDKPFEDTWVLSLDRVFCHEITTPIAITDLMERGKDRVFDPTKIKAVIDHVTPAKDSKTAMQGKILREWAGRNGIKDFSISGPMVCAMPYFQRKAS